MNKNVDKLTDLIELKKKKKDPNNSEKEEFDITWTNLVDDEGFSPDAESFLYGGLVFCGAKPFMKYMNKKDSGVEALDELYNGDLFGINCATTSSLLVHLLGLSLNEQTEDAEVLISLINHIPTASKNKEGKRYGQVDRIFKKYLFEEMAPEIKLLEPEILLRQGLSMDSLKEFSDLMDYVTEKMDSGKLSDTCRNNMNRFTEWIHSFKEKSEDMVFPEEPSQPCDTAVDDACKKDECKFIWKDDIDRLNGELHGLRQKMNALEQLRMTFERNTEEYRSRIASQDEIIQMNASEIAIKNKRIDSLLQELNEQRQEIVSQEEKIKDLQDKISQQEIMIQMIKRDRSKQVDESLNRLASKMKPYYTDYQDAKELEMSIELGENIRDQFEEVLSIISTFVSSN